jgi:hypothetical protein
MEPLGALTGKALGHLERIAVIARHLLLATLTQTDAVTVAKIDCGNYQHRFKSGSNPSALAAAQCGKACLTVSTDTL